MRYQRRRSLAEYTDRAMEDGGRMKERRRLTMKPTSH